MVRYYAMHRVWKEFGPPVYVSVATYLGYNKPKTTAPKIERFEDLVNYVGALPGGVSEPSPFPTF